MIAWNLYGNFTDFLRTKPKKLLTGINKIPSLIENIKVETELRLLDVDVLNENEKKAAAKENEKRKNKDKSEKQEIEPVKPHIYTADEVAKMFRDGARCFYEYDLDFANKIVPVLVSRKQIRKFRSEVTSDNPVSVKMIDGCEYKISREKILNLKKKQLAGLYTTDNDLRETLECYFADEPDENKELVKILEERGIKEFRTKKGTLVKKVKLMEKAKGYGTKNIDDNNKTILDDRKYYCTEIYTDNMGNCNMTAIKYTDIVKKDGRLYLKADYHYPEDYKEHIMYIFKNDYIVIDKNDKKSKAPIEGYYQSIKDINRKRIYIITGNNKAAVHEGITKKCTIKKLYVDIFGKIGGEIKCGEPLSLIEEKK